MKRRAWGTIIALAALAGCVSSAPDGGAGQRPAPDGDLLGGPTSRPSAPAPAPKPVPFGYPAETASAANRFALTATAEGFSLSPIAAGAGLAPARAADPLAGGPKRPEVRRGEWEEAARKALPEGCAIVSVSPQSGGAAVVKIDCSARADGQGPRPVPPSKAGS